MERCDLVRFAVEAGLQSEFGVSEFAYTDRLERFAALVAAAERAKLPPAPMVIRDPDVVSVVALAVAAEREACLSIAGEALNGATMSKYAAIGSCQSARDMASKIEARIRARST